MRSSLDVCKDILVLLTASGHAASLLAWGLLLRMWLGVRPTAASPNETTPKTYQGWMCKTGFFSGFQDQKQKSLADSDFVCDSKVRTIAPDKKTLQYTASTNNRCTRYHRYQIGEGVACSESLHIGESVSYTHLTLPTIYSV